MPWSVSDVDRHKKGLSKKQKEKWVKVANSVLASCLKYGGKQKDCEAKAVRIANGVVGNMDFSITNNVQVNAYEIKRVVFEGRQHIVVPVVMMVEGVHSGSAGPLYHTSEELSKFPGAWNGIPVVINHPEIDGVPVSANEPEVLQSTKVVGRVFNSKFEDGKLKGEVWIDEEKIKIASPETYEIILQGRPLDVSVGVYTDEEPVEGEWNGETYRAIAKNYRPDHLALLPYAKGACSWEDGCGIRVNQNKEGKNVDLDVKELITNGLLAHRINQGFLEIADKVQRALQSLSSENTRYYLQDIFKDYVIYESYNMTDPNGSKLFKRGYKVMEDGTVEFTDDPKEVIRKVDYVPVQNQQTKFVRTNKGGKNMVNNNCCPEKVKLLIQAGLFSEEETELIESLGEQKVNKLVELVNNVQTKKEEKQLTKEEVLNALKEHKVSFDEVKDLLPEEVRSKVEEGLKIHADHRNALIEQITANSEDWQKEELEGFDTKVLEKLAKTLNANKADANQVPNQNVTDYSLAGGQPPETNEEQEILLPPTFYAEQKQEQSN